MGTRDFYWVGSTGATPSAYDWNNPKNWVKLVKPNPSNRGSWRWENQEAVPYVPGCSADNVFIGGFADGITSLSPLLWGGFSGNDGSGNWAVGVGATFTAGSTGNNFIDRINIEWQLGNHLKYPWASVGGGKAALEKYYEAFGGSGPFGGTSSGVFGLTASDLTDTRYNNLRIKAANIAEKSEAYQTGGYLPQHAPKFIDLNLVKYVDTQGRPQGGFYKGYKRSSIKPVWGPLGPLGAATTEYEATMWGGGMTYGNPTSTSKIILSGILNAFYDHSRPSDTWIEIVNDLPTTTQTISARSMVNYGATSWASSPTLGYSRTPGVDLVGCTLASYDGTNLCPLFVDNNSTVGKINIETPWCPQWSFQGRYATNETKPALEIAGEVNVSKAFASVGYSITGGYTGGGFGEVYVNVKPTARCSGKTTQYQGQQELFKSNEKQVGPQIYLGNDGSWTNTTSPANMGVVNILNGLDRTSPWGSVETSSISPRYWPTQVNMVGPVNAGQLSVNQSHVYADMSGRLPSVLEVFSFGIFDMKNYSEMKFNANAGLDNWRFGLTGSTSQVGGIFGDDTSIIRMSQGVQLFNRVVSRLPGIKFNQAGVNSILGVNNLTVDNIASQSL